MIYKVENIEQTKKVAIDFADSIRLGDIVVLSGDLGAGKTTFTQYVFKHLGVTQTVNSPTFAVLKSYVANGKTFHHFDAYRINTPEAIESGFDEIFSDRECIIFVEWAENIIKLLPQHYYVVDIKILDGESRTISIEKV